MFVYHQYTVHDNWAFGDNKVYKDKCLGSFTDLDFIWMLTPKGFPAMMKLLNKTPKQLIKEIETDEKHKNRPFVTKTTKELYEKYLKDLKS